jgi:hypothetical protein
MLRRADPFGSNLTPTPWRGAEVDNTHAFPEEARFVVDFDQLVCRPRPRALSLGACNVGIVQLTFQPLTRRCCAAFAAPNANLFLARVGALAADGHDIAV